MEYEHLTVVFDEGTIAGIEVQLAPDQTVEDWVEQAVADRYGDGETVDDVLDLPRPGRSATGGRE